MLPEKYEWIGVQFEPDEGDPELLLDIGRQLESEGNLEGAATVLNRAFGIAPNSEEVRESRQTVLEQLTVVEHDLLFRYVPTGMFLMGRNDGETDERPWHPVWLSAFWLSETPISWTDYCRLMDWEPPPQGTPRTFEPTEGFDSAQFHLYETNKIRLQYCEDQTTAARDWHSHAYGQLWRRGTEGEPVTAQEMFGSPQRSDPDAPWEYRTKPMVAASWQDALELCDCLSENEVMYSLPTEAQWEKAARGGLIGMPYPWGNAAPTEELCDFDRFRDFAIKPMKSLPPNGYGLFAMCGGVWEWTSDWYDRDFYETSSDMDPTGPEKGEERVLRGGSWADCAEVVNVTYRMSRGSGTWRDGQWGRHLAPNIGFRLCRSRRSRE